jgi:hypothetical protein
MPSDLPKSSQSAQKGFLYATPCAEKRQWRLIKRLEKGKQNGHTRIHPMTCLKVLKAPSRDVWMPPLARISDQGAWGRGKEGGSGQ